MTGTPSNCCCHDDEYNASSQEDPDCVRRFTTTALSSTLHPRYEATGTLSLSASFGTVTVDSGQGSFRTYRAKHDTIQSDGVRLEAMFQHLGDDDPPGGIQRIFLHNWVLEMNWDDYQLKAYTCDNEGQPIDDPWYHQDMERWIFNDTHSDDSRPLEVLIGAEPEIGTGSAPTGTGWGLWRRYIIVAGQPICLQKFGNFPDAFYCGLSAVHPTENTGTGTSGYIQYRTRFIDGQFSSGGLFCSADATYPSSDWFTEQQPLVLSVEKNQGTGTGSDIGFQTDENSFVPSTFYPISQTGNGSQPRGRWAWQNSALEYTGTGDVPPIDFRLGSLQRDSNWGLFAQMSENQGLAAGKQSYMYWEQGNNQPSPKTTDWPEDETADKSIPQDSTYTFFLPGNDELFGPMPELVIKTEGLIKSADPPL